MRLDARLDMCLDMGLEIRLNACIDMYIDVGIRKSTLLPACRAATLPPFMVNNKKTYPSTHGSGIIEQWQHGHEEPSRADGGAESTVGEASTAATVIVASLNCAALSCTDMPDASLAHPTRAFMYD